MKKITFLVAFFMMFFINVHAQFGCDQAVVITNGFTQNGITTPGDGGIEDWTAVPVGTTATGDYWTDDVYLFQYTAGTTDEAVSITTFSRNSWNGIGFFAGCSGENLTGHLASSGSIGTNATKIISATVAAGQTIYIASGQWGSPYDLDFDVVSFTATPIVLPPNCDAALTTPANNSTTALVTGVLVWSAATGSPSGYKLKVGTTSGGNEVGDFVVGNVTTFNIPGILEGDTTYYVTITPTNANGDATSCTEYSFTTGPMPVEGALCENALVVDALPFSATDSTTNYADLYYEGSPGASGCGTTSSYLNGNDVVYSYTAGFTGSVKILLTPDSGNTWGGLFVYGSCADIGVSCLGGVASSSAAPKMIEEFSVVEGQTYYIVISTFASPQTIAYTLDITENTCTNGAATYTVVSDCENGEQFLVNVNVTDLGSATSMSVGDDQGSATQTVTEPGILTFGPYPNNTPVIFNVYNDQDETCFLTSPAMNQAICPPNCSEAIVISECDEEVTADFVAGEGAWNDLSCGYDTPGVEQLFSFTPAETGDYVLEVVTATGGYVDYLYKEASGSCDTEDWICIDDNNGAGTDAIGTLTAGVEYLFLLDSEGTTARTHTFKIQCLPTCTNGTATYTVVSDCENGEQFMVNVDVTSLGTATSVTVSDDQGSATQTLTEPGLVAFGPYPNANPVIFTVNNDQDETCVWTSPAMNQLACPPVNDTCATAIDLGQETSPLEATTIGATNANATVCNNSGNQVANTYGDVYYSILVPNGSTIEIGVTEASYDTANVVFYGDCENRTTIACFDDPNYTIVEWSNETGQDQTVYWIQDGWSGTGTFTLEWLVYACTPAEATYTVVSDCENGDQFLVTVDVTNMGSATSLTVGDDQGSATQTVAQTGVVTFGPYPNANPVIFTVVNDQDALCTLTSPAMNQIACPPVNDDCATATALVPGEVFDDNAIEATNAGATKNANDPVPTCDAYDFVNVGKDVWFSVVAPASGTLTLETKTNGGTTLTDTGLQVYSGECGSLTSLGCNADDGDGNFSKLSLSDLVEGETLLVRVWGYSGSFGSFMIAAYDASLSNSKFESANFRAYPNPVKDVLNLSYNQNISNVEVFNMLGQQVMTKSINANQDQVNMSNLTSGTYLVKITADGHVKTIKVLKQ